MPSRLIRFTATVLCLGFALTAIADPVRYRDPLVAADLLQLHAQEIRGRTQRQIQQANETLLRRLESTEFASLTGPSLISRQGRVTRVPRRTAQILTQSMDRHPVVSSYAQSKYDRRDVEIGFCFGRAMYSHVALLQLGVDESVIKKIWAVGPMQGDGVSWGFHVATIVPGEDGTWYVIDNFPGRMLELREWVRYVLRMDKTHTVRLYVTDPRKFSVSLGGYDRVQLGLDLQRDQDWYRHYFRDLMRWFADHDANRAFYRENRLTDLRRRQR